MILWMMMYCLLSFFKNLIIKIHLYINLKVIYKETNYEEWFKTNNILDNLCKEIPYITNDDDQISSNGENTENNNETTSSSNNNSGNNNNNNRNKTSK